MSDQFVYVVDSGLISIPEIERAFDNSPRTTIAALVLVLPMFPAENIAVVIGLPPDNTGTHGTQPLGFGRHRPKRPPVRQYTRRWRQSWLGLRLGHVRSALTKPHSDAYPERRSRSTARIPNRIPL